MSKQSNPRLGLGPLLSSLGSPRSDHLRVSDAERQAVADRLAEHYGEGRLDQAEFDERISRAMSAKTRADFSGLFDDLPEPGPTGALGASGVAGPGVAPDRRARRDARRHRHHHHGLLTLGLIVVVAYVAAHVMHTIFWLTVPWLWLGVIAVILLVATGHLGHSHSRSGGSGDSDGNR
jgi:hypothetical protein